MKLPKPLQNLKDSFEKLPGIGPKTAERLTFHLLRVPQADLDLFSSSVSNLKQTKICSICKNVGENDICAVCSDLTRDKNTILVVQSPLDVLAFEKSGYRGVYHVLHGSINPIAGIGPEELFIDDLVERVFWGEEIIIATNPDLEGEATALYIKEKLSNIEGVKITRIGRGLPTGADIEYADETTLKRALEGRTVS
ncbi:recombination mediator RecR [Candidatus Parcubacteria bacterium]|nr:recombination mediator RecR [Patescibacteria group bacterium]MBU4381310.1 recombination mediator RecR [Patescibacteria group bacterium]MCG2689027.1 recombination mediator RecR [Candidatus Parcubacteria bacterium]